MSLFQSPPAIRIFGIITILFWLSLLLFLPAVKTITPAMEREMAETREMRKMLPEMYKSEAILKAEHARSVQARILMIAVISAGVFSGVLLAMLRFTGWIMAIVLCAGLLLLRVIELARYYPDIGGRLNVIFTLLMPQHPAATIYHEVITPLFFIMTILFLARKSIGRLLMIKRK